MHTPDRIAAQLGIMPETRERAARELYLATEQNPLTYWAQLFIAAGIAHLGLVLNSTAVVIGAMLVSPLMTPIVQVGMGFAVGNLFLAMKAASRILASILITVSFAALMTKIMPYEDVTAEILARTRPTALDLEVAMFCGLAAAFTTARGSKDTISAAAGTAIAIALVPPLCVIGFGVGVGSLAIVWGANLLFIANLSAIILISDIFFLITGFSRIDVQALEEEVLSERDRESPLYSITKNLRFSSAISRRRTFRVLLPVIFVSIVLFPLSKALRQVAWEVEAKKQVNRVLNDFGLNHQVLNSRQDVTYKSISVRLMVVGEPAASRAMEKELGRKLETAAGIPPDLTVEVVPSTAFMDEMLKTSADRFSREVAALKLERDKAAENPQTGFLDAAARKLPVSFLVERIRESFSGELAFFENADSEGRWTGWSVSIGPGPPKVTLQRISDSGLSESTMTIIAGILKEKTGLSVLVEEDRLPKTIYRSKSDTVGKTLRAGLEARLKSVVNIQNVGASLCLPAENRRNASLRRVLPALVKGVIPENRVRVSACEGEWSIGLFRTDLKPETGPRGESRVTAGGAAPEATPVTP